MSFDLLFRRLRNPAARDIVFGQPIGPVTDANGRFVVTLPGVSLQLTARLEYDLAVSRSDMIGVMSAWGASDPVAPASTTAMHGSATPVSTARTFRWRRAAPQAADCRVPWQKLTSIPSSRTTSWGNGKPVSAGSSAPWRPAAILRNSARAGWQPGIPVGGAATSPWQPAVIIRRPGDRIRWGAGDPTPISITARATSAEPVVPVTVRLPWNAAEHLPPGRTVVVIPPLPPVWRCYTPPAGGAAHLLFDKRRTPGFDILFSCGSRTPTGPRVVPILECYIVINAVSLVRADNGAEIPADALQLGIGSDGPHWTWSASLPGYARSLVADRPEVIATLNGTPVRLVVERVRRDRRASLRGISDALQISGRSPSAWLSNPFAPASARTSESPYTAQQLAAEALTLNGASMGWALDWRLPDWLVPAGAWSHRGTPMEAVLRIAEAGGGYIQAAAASQTLRALPHYPAAPWLWASLSPDLVLPEDVVEVEGTETADTAAYDVVYVEGIGPAGRRDRVRRTGTAGILPAPQIIDPLATDPDMTRARGLVALAASGPQTRVTLRLPVLQETGLILPGTLLDYAAEGATRRGIVRSFQADWTHPELWQSVEVECHG